ncbi:hypothetical protein ACFQ60_39645 [Streptomyces zhihengii]
MAKAATVTVQPSRSSVPAISPVTSAPSVSRGRSARTTSSVSRSAGSW